VRGSGVALALPAARFEPGPTDSSSPVHSLPCSEWNPLDAERIGAYVPIPRAGGVGRVLSRSLAFAAVS